jgi:uncharacterized protein with PQ loop repeat
MNIIGIITVVLSLIVTGVGLTSQARKNHKRRSTEGLSHFYFVILAISYTFWTIYGFVLDDLIIIIPMSIGAMMSWFVVTQFFFYKNNN